MIAAAAILTAAIFLGANLVLFLGDSFGGARPYRVEVSRIAKEIERHGHGGLSLSGYRYVTNVEKIGERVPDGCQNAVGGTGEAGFGTGKKDEKVSSGVAPGNLVLVDPRGIEADSDYLIREIGGVVYRFDYTADAGGGTKSTVLIVNILLGAMALFLFGILFYIRFQILLPLHKLVDVPRQLSRGTLTVPLQESKNRYFGQFVWGMDLLRENMEGQKKEALKRQQEHETMLSSLSHDIKTPLAAIKLYVKALEKGLYTEKEKQRETAENIGKKADEVEAYAAQLTDTLREDFLSLSVKEGEFYLSVLLQEIQQHYRERLLLAGTDFTAGECADCLLAGDVDRGVEILQNFMENAIKYGDGRWISLDISQEDNCVLVTVRNSGCTLFEAELPHIFESFWRGSNVGALSGSGLGLFICRQLMHRMGGEVFATKDGDVFAVTAVFVKVS